VVVGVAVMMVSMSVIIASAVWRGRVVEVSVIVFVVVVVAMVSMSVIIASAVWRDGSVEVSMVVVVWLHWPIRVNHLGSEVHSS
jgi:hypothetical protein